jgi:hypothetical protein
VSQCRMRCHTLQHMEVEVGREGVESTREEKETIVANLTYAPQFKESCRMRAPWK